MVAEHLDRQQKKLNHTQRGALKLKELSLLVCARGGIEDNAVLLKHVAAAAGQVSQTLWQQRRLYKEFCIDHFPINTLPDCMNYFRIELRDEAILYIRRRLGRKQSEYSEYRRKYSGITASRDLDITKQEAVALDLKMIVPQWIAREVRWERMTPEQIATHRRNQTRAATQAQVDRSKYRQEFAIHLRDIGYTMEMIQKKVGVCRRTLQRYLATSRFVQRLNRAKATAQSVFVRAKERFSKIVSLPGHVFRVPKASSLPGVGTNYGDEPAKNAEPSPKSAPLYI